MTFNPLKEKGMPIEKQFRVWKDIAKRPYDKTLVDCYTRTRQILMNGIEIEAWCFKHNFARIIDDVDDLKILAATRRVENQQQITVNWLTPGPQSVLETTLGYEQVAVDLTSWLAQNEPDEYVKETFNFGLLEDFDHLYRYSQWYAMQEGEAPDYVLQGQTDVFPGRPTQFHHNPNECRLRKHYDKAKTHPQTKANILTLVSAEQQTHNFYAEHGFMYANDKLRQTYAEIKDVEEEHVTMYESLIDPTESLFEKLVTHEFCEICNYYNCMNDETDDRIKLIWEEFLAIEIEHLKIANKLLQKYEKRDAEEIIGTKVFNTCTFKSQKDYVQEILDNEVDKRLDCKDTMNYTYIENLQKDWASYDFQETVNNEGCPTEATVSLSIEYFGQDIITRENELGDKEADIIKKGQQKKGAAPDTVGFETYKEIR